MNQRLRSICRAWLSLVVGVVFPIASPASAATFSWTGNFGTSYDFQLNWVLIDGGPAVAPPDAGDTAIFALAGEYDVRFAGDRMSNEIVVTTGTPTFAPSGASDATYFVSGQADVAGGELNIDDGGVTSSNPDMILQAGSVRVRSLGEINVRNGSRLITDQVLLGSGTTGRILVDGRDTVLEVEDEVQSSSFGLAGGNGFLTVQQSGRAELFGAPLVIGADDATGSRGRLLAQLGGTIVTDSLLVGSAGLQDQMGELRSVGKDIFDIPASIEMRDGATLTLGAGQRSTGLLLISGGANFTTGTGLTTVNATGDVDLLLGTLQVRGDLLVNGGRIEIDDDQSQFTLAEASQFDIRDGGLVSSGAGIDFPEDSLVQIFSRDATLLLHDNISHLRSGARMEVTDTGRLELQSAELIIEPGAELHIDGGGLFISTLSPGDSSRIDVDGGVLEHSLGGFETDASEESSITLRVHNAGEFTLENGKLPAFHRIDVIGSRTEFNASKSVLALGGDAIVEITDEASAAVSHLTIGGGLLDNNSSIAAVPLLRVSDATLRADLTKETSIIGTHRPTTPEPGDATRVTVENGGVVRFADLTVGHVSPTEVDGHGEVIVRSGGQMHAAHVNIASQNGNATGLIEVADADSMVVQSAGSALNIGFAGSDDCCPAMLRVVSGATYQAGTLPVNVRATGTIDLLVGTFIAPGGVQLNGGRLFARGTVEGNVTNAGLVDQPFLPEGTPDGTGLVIHGDFIQQAGGTTQWALFPSATPGTVANEAIEVHGMAELDGTLLVELVDIGGGGLDFSLGDAFDLLTASEGISGQFATALLPALDDNLAFRLTYGSNVVRLRVVAQGVPGDYNEDGVVNAGDYVVWRNHEGTAFDLPNRNPNNNGDISLADYQFWVANFGNTSGSGTTSPLPESSSMALMLGALLVSACRQRGSRVPAREVGRVATHTVETIEPQRGGRRQTIFS